MSAASSKQALPDKSLAEQQLDIFLSPFTGRQSLQEHHHFLKIHSQELLRPFHQKCCTNIKMELRETLFFRLLRNQQRTVLCMFCVLSTYEVCIPHPNGIPDAEFPHQETVHPTKTELHKLYTLSLQMFGQSSINTCSQIMQ
jgi:hypothetical protein